VRAGATRHHRPPGLTRRWCWSASWTTCASRSCPGRRACPSPGSGRVECRRAPAFSAWSSTSPMARGSLPGAGGR
jgi:hypothetical protein